MFSFFKKKISPDAAATPSQAAAAESAAPAVTTAERPRESWIARLGQGLRRTGQSIGSVFTGTRIDDALYEELESALLMADAGVQATEYLLRDLKQRVKDTSTTEPAAVKALLAAAIAALIADMLIVMVLSGKLRLRSENPAALTAAVYPPLQSGDAVTSPTPVRSSSTCTKTNRICEVKRNPFVFTTQTLIQKTNLLKKTNGLT